ncbi:hypothetical protein AB0442_32910 [Kitasatospora sp. NPDC085895]|uniref:hypothetical protein n=1 Tax=Kitasatospora sp. NPDC085895 TaxID=3155057 RepID=UPI00344DD856
MAGHPPSLQHDGSITVGRRTWDADTLGLPEEGVELRMFGNGIYVGRFMLEPTPGTVPSRQARLVAVTLADHAGAALDSLTRPVKAALTDAGRTAWRRAVEVGFGGPDAMSRTAAFRTSLRVPAVRPSRPDESLTARHPCANAATGATPTPTRESEILSHRCAW